LERLIANQEDRISFLERELECRGDKAERLHQIVAGLTRATAELSARLPELEAPKEAPGGAESTVEKPERAVELRSATRGPQTTSERLRDTAEFPEGRSLTRPWWRRVFGG
jgi:hypothetical protein